MALAVMRRHKRWLYVFLWLVIAAFIILYIPAFQGSTGAGTPGEVLARVGGLPITVGEYQSSYRRQRPVLPADLPGSAGRGGLAPHGARAADLRLPGRGEAGHAGGRAGGPLRVRRLPGPRHRHRIRASSANGRYVGAVEIKRLLEMQGITEAEFERGDTSTPPAGEPGRPGHGLGERLRCRGGEGVPPPQRAGQGRVRPRGCRPLPDAGDGRRRRREGALRQGARELPDPREACALLHPPRPGDAAAAGHRDRPRDRGLLPGASATSSGRRPRSVPATCWSRSRLPRTRRTGIRRRRRRAWPRRSWRRRGAGPISEHSRGSPRRTRAPRRAGATSAASPAGAWCPSSTRPSSPWRRGRSRTWSRPTSGTTSSGWLR